MSKKVIKRTESGACVLLGYICERNGGYWFNPRISHRRPSRKLYDTELQCVPRWARVGEIVDCDEATA